MSMISLESSGDEREDEQRDEKRDEQRDGVIYYKEISLLMPEAQSISKENEPTPRFEQDWTQTSALCQEFLTRNSTLSQDCLP